eukprot:PhM_4_TR13821/c0_g1_i1/m.67190
MHMTTANVKDVEDITAPPITQTDATLTTPWLNEKELDVSVVTSEYDATKNTTVLRKIFSCVVAVPLTVVVLFLIASCAAIVYLVSCGTFASLLPAAIVSPVAVVVNLVFRHPALLVLKLYDFFCGRHIGRCTGSNSRLEVIRVNGADHVIRIRGIKKDKHNNNIILFLHGGPGMTEMLAGGGQTCRQMLERDFVVVDYDQRSASSSGYLNRFVRSSSSSSASFNKTLTIEQHVRDAAKIAQWLALGAPMTLKTQTQLLPPAPGSTRNKVHLCGGSWGSVLALRTAAFVPSLFHGPIIVRGLVTSQASSERLGGAYIEKTIRSLMARTAQGSRAYKDFEKDLKYLSETLRGDPQGSYDFSSITGVHQMLKQRELLSRYGGDKYETYARINMNNNKTPGHPDAAWIRMYKLMTAAVTAHEISLGALLRGKSNAINTLECMGSIWDPRRPPQPERLEVDLVVAQGRHDNCTASLLVPTFLQNSLFVCPGRTKRLVWFERSGHAPCKEEPEEFAALLTSVWLGMGKCKYVEHQIL